MASRANARLSCLYLRLQDLFGEPGRVEPHFGTAAARDLVQQLQRWTGAQLSGSGSTPLELPGAAALQEVLADLLHSLQVGAGPALPPLLRNASKSHEGNCLTGFSLNDFSRPVQNMRFLG